MSKKLDGFKDVKKLFESLNKAIEKNKGKFQEIASNHVQSLMKSRIFNDGIATDGTRIGKYAAGTKKARSRKGRRTDTVDLQDSGTLKRSIQTGKSGKNVVVGFVPTNEPGTDFKTLENAITQEKNFKKEIFAPTEEEEKEGEEAFIREIFIFAQKTLK